MSEKKDEVKITAKSSEGLRDMLFNEVDLLRKGESNPARARAVSSLSHQILKSVHLEIEMHKYVSSSSGKALPEKKASMAIDL